ncbi:MAG: L,D-transpeptidase [Candidatus Sericytochromatia bacterium]
MRFLMICLSLLMIQLPGQALSPETVPASAPRIPAASTQMILVITDEWQAVPATLYRYERPVGGAWQAAGKPIEAVVGSKGMGWGRGLHKDSDTNGDYRVEFDKRAPAGIFTLGAAFGLGSPAQARKWLRVLKMPYLQLKPGLFCIGDHESKHYNEIVDSRKVAKDWKDEHIENMNEIAVADEQAYFWGVFVNHNVDSNPPGMQRDRISGSCIFLHIWKEAGHGTAGCTAMSRNNMVSVIQWLDQARHPILVQLPKAEYLRLKQAWNLPELEE